MKLKLLLFFLITVYYSFSGFLVSVFFPELDYIGRFITFFADIVIILLCFSTFFYKKISYLKKILLLFLFFSSITYILNYQVIEFFTHLNGLREILICLSALIIIEDIFNSNYKNKFIKNFDKYLFIFAFLQLPTSLLEFKIYGIGDKVGGTYGTSGGSGLVALLLFIISYYFIVKFASTKNYKDLNIKKLILISLLLIPCVLNETKISFFLIIFYIIILVCFKERNYKSIFIIIFGSILFIFIFYMYKELVKNPSSIFTYNYIKRFLFLESSSGTGLALGRFAKIKYMFLTFSKDIGKYLFGMGYGLFKGGNVLSIPRVATSLYFFYGLSRPLIFTAWIQGGFFLILLLIMAMFSFIRKSQKLFYSDNRIGFKIFIFLILCLIWVYNDAILDRVFAIIISYFIILIRDFETNSESIILNKKEI